jgi:hypothetical protein
MTSAHGASSGRKAAASPARTAARRGRAIVTAASVARAVTTPVSIPLAAHAPIGNARATTTRPTAAWAAEPRLARQTPRAAAATVHAITPTSFARTSTSSASPYASGARSRIHGKGVTPSLGAAPTSKRQPLPPATFIA